MTGSPTPSAAPLSVSSPLPPAPVTLAPLGDPDAAVCIDGVCEIPSAS